MTILVISAIVVFCIYMVCGTLLVGTRNSLSQFGNDWSSTVFMLVIWTEVVLLMPPMFEATPDGWHWLVFLTGAGLMFTGGASIITKDSFIIHCAGAAVSCISCAAWLSVINPLCLLIPVIMIASGGYDKWQWSGEIGLIMAVYLTLL